MRNGSWVLGVLLVVGWAACASRTRETAVGAQESSRQQAQEDDGLPRLQQTDGGCAVDPCREGGPGCLAIAVETGSARKRFDPKPGVQGWKLCSGQGLEITSDLDEDLCIELRDVRSDADGGVVSLTKLRSKSAWSNPDLPAGEYCLSICDDKDHQCSKGCANSDCVTDDQTIRGNLDVVTKVPEPDSDRE